MAKAKRRSVKKKRSGGKPARRKSTRRAAKKKTASGRPRAARRGRKVALQPTAVPPPAPLVPRPVSIPGAWPFPMISKP